jgi:hypothetical protein
MSSTELLRAYWSERYPALVYMPLAALIFIAGTVAVGARITPMAAAESIGLVFALVLLFRVWDDLADREEDRVRAPQRVLARVESVAPLLGLMAALACASIALLVIRERFSDIALLIVTAAGLATWYGIRARLGANPLANAHALLLKYPLIALIATPAATRPQPAPMIAALSALYLGLCVREMLDDARIRADRRVHGLLSVEVALLTGLLFLTLFTGGLPS